MGIELLYTPSYSPDLNPVELCFSKIKTILNGELKELVHTNLYLAAAEAVDTIKANDMIGYFEATSYLFIQLAVELRNFTLCITHWPMTLRH